jgi:hypothetical protein
MKTRSILNGVLLLSLGSCGSAVAGQVSIMVAEGKEARCLEPAEPERTQYLMTSAEALKALDNYFKGIGNPQLQDAAIVNAGIRFCSGVERKAVFSGLLQALGQPSISQRLLEVASNYYGSKTLHALIREASGSKTRSPILKENLRRLREFAAAARSRAAR